MAQQQEQQKQQKQQQQQQQQQHQQQHQQRRLVLIGPTGVGKSCTGNLLVGSDSRCRQPFQISSSYRYGTRYISAESSAAHGWTVIDTPGMEWGMCLHATPASQMRRT